MKNYKVRYIKGRGYYIEIMSRCGCSVIAKTSVSKRVKDAFEDAKKIYNSYINSFNI
jgi:hypothetical protein